MLPRFHAGNEALGSGNGCLPSRGPRRGTWAAVDQQGLTGSCDLQVPLWVCCSPLLRFRREAGRPQGLVDRKHCK